MFVTKCGAKARTNKCKPCRQPAMLNGRCRLHGGLSTGIKTQEGIRRVKEANLKHGFYSAEAIAERRSIKGVIRAMKANNESLIK